MEILDVTTIEPRFKHPTIFNKFDALAAGEAFVLHNDHDPIPLYYQLKAERGEIFDWVYLSKGPEKWEIKISKFSTNEASATIGELVASDYRKAEVFRKFGIDFCCGGNKSVKEACDENGINPEAVEVALSEAENQPGNSQQDFKNWDLDFLADYIVNTHHKYVKESIPMLYEISNKVASVHGDLHPEVIEIAGLFDAIATEFNSHMLKEEDTLFPLIKALVIAKRDNESIEPFSFGTIGNPIRMMELEHENAGNNMKKIHELSNDFTPPEEACSSYQFLYAKLEEFEKDMHQHIHLENNILFPKAIELENQLFKKNA